MLMWIAVVALILAGLALIIVEILFIPGTTLVGLLGLVLAIAGIVTGYSEFGNVTGNYILLATSLATGVALYMSFRKGAWNRFSLNSSIDSKVNEGVTAGLSVGNEGVAVSALRPMGTADFQDKMIEVKTNGDYLAPGTRIRIVKIITNDILVEPIT